MHLYKYTLNSMYSEKQANTQEIKAWKHSCALGSPVRAPKDISHGFRGGWSAGGFMLQSDQKIQI